MVGPLRFYPPYTNGLVVHATKKALFYVCLPLVVQLLKNTFFLHVIPKGSRKKNPPLIAGPLRGGGGKGRAIKETRTFSETFFLFCRHLKIKIILLWTTYRNMEIC